MIETLIKISQSNRETPFAPNGEPVASDRWKELSASYMSVARPHTLDYSRSPSAVDSMLSKYTLLDSARQQLPELWTRLVSADQQPSVLDRIPTLSERLIGGHMLAFTSPEPYNLRTTNIPEQSPELDRRPGLNEQQPGSRRTLASARSAPCEGQTADAPVAPKQSDSARLLSFVEKQLPESRRLMDSVIQQLPDLRTVVAPIEQLLPDLRGILKQTGTEQAFDSLIKLVTSYGGDPKSQNADWTVALNLTTYFEQDEEGIFYRLEDLKKFAEKTKGTKLTIVAQVAYKQDSEVEGENPPCQLERYVVKDGEITKISSAKSKGYAQDLQDLVAYASKRQGASKMALIMDSHGMGNEGMFGDSGSLTVDGFVQRVRSGLEGSGRNKLDLVHFDSCYMAQNGVMSRLSAVADHLVASAESEEVDGISLLPTFELLRTTPNTDANGLGRHLVSEARVQDKDFVAHGWPVPIPTISHVNLKHYTRFRTALDALGEKLADILKDSSNKGALEKAIDSARKYGTDGSVTSLKMKFQTKQYRVDLKDFLEGVANLVDDGTIKDDDRSLKKCIQAVLQERSTLVEASYGHGKYSGHGGVSVFIPGKDFRDIERESHLRTGAGRLVDMTRTENLATIFKDPATTKQFTGKIRSELAWMRPMGKIFGIELGVEGVDKEREALEKSLEALLKAKNPRERREGLAELHKAAADMEKTEPYKKRRKEALQELKEQSDELFKVQLDDAGKTGWTKFRQVLCGRTPAQK